MGSGLLVFDWCKRMKRRSEVIQTLLGGTQGIMRVFQIFPEWFSSCNTAGMFPGQGYHGRGVYSDGGRGE